MTSKLARQIHLYVFYGKWRSKNGKTGPIIRLLHKKIIQGRHRFGKYVDKHFGPFLAAMDSNPGWQVFFDDKGAGTPPNEYLLLVERGLRSFGDDVHAMGAKAMATPADWEKPERKWRKREAYIALVRFVRQRESYRQWDNFKWTDYVERQKLAMTFMKRHFPLSKAGAFGGQLDPKAWTDGGACSPKHKKIKRSKSEKGATASSAAPVTAGPDEPQPAPMQHWDVDNECFVPIE